jgi:hypothetical protein
VEYVARRKSFATLGWKSLFSVIGEANKMHPMVRDEIYRIAYEAIRNTVQTLDV